MVLTISLFSDMWKSTNSLLISILCLFKIDECESKLTCWGKPNPLNPLLLRWRNLAEGKILFNIAISNRNAKTFVFRFCTHLYLVLTEACSTNHPQYCSEEMNGTEDELKSTCCHEDGKQNNVPDHDTSRFLTGWCPPVWLIQVTLLSARTETEETCSEFWLFNVQPD